MKQHHPLENPSITPYGFVFAKRQQRLEYRPPDGQHWVNEERLIARLWDKVNRQNASKPLPAKTIVHDLLPGFGTQWRIASGDFVHDGLPYLTRDILVLSSTLQWLGTNVGRCFLGSKYEPDLRSPGTGKSGREREPMRYHPSREFILKLQKENRELRGFTMEEFFVHQCTDRCRWNEPPPLQGCRYSARDVSERDKMVIHALMYWLGSNAGRGFLLAFDHRKKTAWDHVHALREASYRSKSA